MMNEHAHGVQVHGFDAPQIPLDHLGIIRPASQPVFKVVAIGQPDAAGGHVVHAMCLPRLAPPPEPAVTRLDVLRLRFRLPDAQFMPQAVNHCPAQRQTRRDTDFAGIPRKPSLFDGLRLAWRKRNLAVEHCPARDAFGIQELHRNMQVADRFPPEVHHPSPRLKLLPCEDSEELAAALAEKHALLHARQRLPQTIGHYGLPIEACLRRRQHGPHASAKRRLHIHHQRPQRAPVVPVGRIISPQQRLPPIRPPLLEPHAPRPRIQAHVSQRLTRAPILSHSLPSLPCHLLVVSPHHHWRRDREALVARRDTFQRGDWWPFWWPLVAERIRCAA